MMRRLLRSAVLLTAALAPAALVAPAPAHANSAAVLPGAAVPPQLDSATRAFYADVFQLIDAGEWPRVAQLLEAREGDPLRQVALAEYYLHPNSPRIELDALNAWLADSSGRALPQADQIGRLALKRGLEERPDLPQTQRLVYLRGQEKRTRPAPARDPGMPESVAEAILDRIKNDDPRGARLLLDGVDGALGPAGRAEWRQRVAWSHYIENDDAAALALGRNVANGGSGPWVAEGWWVSGLAAWRLGDCGLAADGFSRAAGSAGNVELRAAAHYWHARSQTRCRRPDLAADALRAAAGYGETLYGMLAAEQLNMDLPAQGAGQAFSGNDWARLADEPNVRTAIALIEVGQEGLADEVLRHQARIGTADEYPALSRLARALGLPGAQLYMAYNAPRGARPDPATRYPTTRWQPVDGWRVDPALAYAHTLQESRFQAGAVSPAGAVGLMQIMPATARDNADVTARHGSNLKNPAINMAIGQRTLEKLRDRRDTQGLLPKIMAAYNAGPAPVSRWNSEVRDQGDPLLYMESIPYWETRGYVAIVTGNYWMYERQAGRESPTRTALAQNLWPRFPGVSGADAYAEHGKPVLSGAVRDGR